MPVKLLLTYSNNFTCFGTVGVLSKAPDGGTMCTEK